MTDRTMVSGKAIEGSVNERHHLERVLVELGKVPCDCVEWEKTIETGPMREFIGFRNWSARVDCEHCEGEGSFRP